MITRIDVYVGGQFSCEYEFTPVLHEKNTVPVRRGYYCVRRVTLHQFDTFVNLWGFFDPIPDIWRATTAEAICLAESIVDKGDFAVGFNSWRDAQRVWQVDPNVSKDCERELYGAISRFQNRWLERIVQKQTALVGTQVPGKK